MYLSERPDKPNDDVVTVTNNTENDYVTTVISDYILADKMQKHDKKSCTSVRNLVVGENERDVSLSTSKDDDLKENSDNLRVSACNVLDRFFLLVFFSAFIITCIISSVTVYKNRA